MDEKDALLTVRDLQIEFHDHRRPETAVFDFDLTMMPGEITGIVGESGAGKSLSALAVAGLLKRHSEVKNGTIVFDGQELLHCDRRVLRSYQGDEIAVIFQEPMSSLNPVKRVGPQVEESLLVHHKEIDRTERRRRALCAMESVGLPDAAGLYRRYPHELSGGQRQRVMIAAAMIAEPKLLIADESTTALDVTVQAQIIALLKEINEKRGTAILFISHDLSLVRSLCRRVLVMRNGRIVEEGEADRIFIHPRETYTRALIDAVPKIGGKTRTMCSGRTVLQVDHLNAGYGRKRQVLQEVSFSLGEGEILGLAGESGSGKSTLAKSILGLLPAENGSISRNGMRAQMVFQDPYGSLNPSHTVEFILTEALTGGRRRGRRREELRARAADALRQVELSEDFLDRRPGELSGGQRQRVAIAEALTASPNVLIADEPVSALDVTVQAQIMELLMRLRRETGVSILIISHDLRVLYRLCDRIMVMKDGHIVEENETTALFAKPQHPYTRELLASTGGADIRPADDT